MLPFLSIATLFHSSTPIISYNILSTKIQKKQKHIHTKRYLCTKEHLTANISITHDMEITESRSKSFFIIGIIYVIALAVGIVTWKLTSSLLLGDVAATIFTWAMGLVYKNVSVYDPYWSVAPPLLLTLYYFSTLNNYSTNICAILILITIWIWGIRLTANWAITFKGLKHEDWRYTKYRKECNPVIFQLINFFGLNMMPTIVVFLSMRPAINLIENPGTAHLNWFNYLGACMCIAAVVIQHLADTTAHRFRAQNPGKICKEGLWRKGRHPNYFGEILMWWGVWMQCHSNEEWLSEIIGPLSITVLFLFVSIPLMEKRQLENKPGYAEYRKETRILI